MMRIDYQLQVEAEFHIGSGLSRPGVVDETLLVRPDGTLFIPSEHFRGLVRDACTQVLLWTGKYNSLECCEASLKKAPTERDRREEGVLKTCGLNWRRGKELCVLCRLFGTTFVPKSYYFSDAELTSDERQRLIEKNDKRIITYNRLDPATGRVLEEFLFSFEMGAPATFKGYIERLAPQTDTNLLFEEVSLLIAGLRLVERVGRRSARGWGRCEVKIEKIMTAENKELSEGEWKEWLSEFLRGGMKKCIGCS